MCVSWCFGGDPRPMEFAVSINVAFLASFFIGLALGGVLTYMFLSARLQQEKQRLADELHTIIEREERAARQVHRTAA